MLYKQDINHQYLQSPRVASFYNVHYLQSPWSLIAIPFLTNHGFIFGLRIPYKHLILQVFFFWTTNHDVLKRVYILRLTGKYIIDFKALADKGKKSIKYVKAYNLISLTEIHLLHTTLSSQEAKLSKSVLRYKWCSRYHSHSLHTLTAKETGLNFRF